MKQLSFDDSLAGFMSKYPDLFEEFRKEAGWHMDWRANPSEVDREPCWPKPFPMHNLAREFLLRFLGVRCIPDDWRGIEFGCKQTGTARTLKETNPYDAERFVLMEKWHTERPPAFPIGTMNDWMIFLRDDWSTITISYCWKDFLLTSNPFEVIDEFRQNTDVIWSDPKRHIVVSNLDQVPASLIGSVYVS